jgi:hypothetical protein
MAEVWGFVKITLRRRSTGYFLGQNDKWVPSGLQARGFASEPEALRKCETLCESDVYVYVLMDNPAENIAATENCART